MRRKRTDEDDEDQVQRYETLLSRNRVYAYHADAYAMSREGERIKRALVDEDDDDAMQT